MDLDERVLTLHWDGTQWSIENNPNVGTQQNSLNALAATSGGELWAVGTLRNPGLPPPQSQTLIEHHVDPCTPCAISFTDVQPADYFFQPVQYLYCRSIVSGYSDNTFRPYNNTTRAQLAKIVVLAENWPIYYEVPRFRDVPDNNPFYPYIETAHYRDVISGYSCGTNCLEFRPNNSVTRGQVAKMVVLAENWQLLDPPTPTFTDVPRGSAFYKYVETAYSHNIISGYSCGTSCLEFRPGNTATRGQISKIAYYMLDPP